MMNALNANRMYGNRGQSAPKLADALKADQGQLPTLSQKLPEPLKALAQASGTPLRNSEGVECPTVRLLLSSEQVERFTVVNPLTNARDQEGLSLELLSHITGTWTGQNSLPAVGRLVDGKIEVLAGSCRRFVAIAKNGHYLIDVAFDLPETQARFIASTAESQMPQSAWERGNVALQMEQRDQIDRKLIAERLNIDASALSKVMNAVSQLEQETKLKRYFGSYRSLGIAPLSALGKSVKPLLDNSERKRLFYSELDKLQLGTEKELSDDKRSQQLVKLCQTASSVALGKQKPAKIPVETTTLWENNKSSVKQVVDENKRQFSIVTTRLNKEQREKLAKYIDLAISKFDM